MVQGAVFIFFLVGLSVPIGFYIYRVMMGEKTFLDFVCSPLERFLYRSLGTEVSRDMSAGEYGRGVLLFSTIGFVFLWALQLLQKFLPFNPNGVAIESWHLAFNTAASYVSNTNWQAYSGEKSMSYLTQSIGLTVQNFTSAATGMAVLFALLRGITAVDGKGIGNFWRDLIRIHLYILLPMSFMISLLLVSQGVVQTFAPYQVTETLEKGLEQIIPLGPAASQIAIKQLGTNGGGFFGANSAFPLENPTGFSNFLETICILLIPASLCITFGKAVQDMGQGRALYAAKLILFGLALVALTASEMYLGPTFSGAEVGGNMEGKEALHGIESSALWGAATTAASNGSSNASLGSFTPLGGLVLLFLMQSGEVIFGGVGSGLYGMLGFVFLTVFVAGLMVGRTPEYLGKKIDIFSMQMVCILVLTPVIGSLLGTLAAVLHPGAMGWLTNPGPHGFTEILYAFSSMGNNNGSIFGGFHANTLFVNVTGGIIMLAVRFVPMIAVLHLAEHLAAQKKVAIGAGTLSTKDPTFILLLIGMILIVGTLSFLPALSLGPIADFAITRN